ncbi:hypothetical protein BHE74_00040495 [Ensete ventricosum]|nr:hypothetical protein BHE74_00040495 [Ensete ventricosum]RZS02373.1 hypothetical protein BHM03_00032420 [Ensete ventricosum]
MGLDAKVDKCNDVRSFAERRVGNAATEVPLHVKADAAAVKHGEDCLMQGQYSVMGTRLVTTGICWKRDVCLRRRLSEAPRAWGSRGGRSFTVQMEKKRKQPTKMSDISCG